MSAEPDQSKLPNSRPKGNFVPTRWSLVLHSRSENPQESESALAELCQLYWFPLYGFVQRSGKSHEEVEDLASELRALISALST